MRARSLKPSLFKNEILGTSDLVYTILFEGLWCLADREGRLEDRPRRIKAEIFPYRDCDVEELLKWLSDNGFITRYRIGEEQYIAVTKFGEHQSPHTKECASTIPAPDEHRTRTRRASGKTQPIPALAALTPDSGLLTPDSIKKGAAAPDPDGLDLKAWEVWQGYRRLKPASISLAKRKLASHGKDQLAVVEHSIANGYQGLIAPKANGQTTPQDREADELQKLTDRRAAIGLPNFRPPNPGETVASYRAAQDDAWNALKRAPIPKQIAELAARLKA